MSNNGLRGDAPEKVIQLKLMEIVGDLDKTAWCKRIEGRFESMFNRLKRFKCTTEKPRMKGTVEQKLDKHEHMITSCVIICQIEQEFGIKMLYDLTTDSHEYIMQ